ncbi:AMP-binding protein [Actinomycetospora sp. NBRC 106378]|uniref:AMP-binding protein n=1 Tax=Actinomycetospora sp. NBRC 106378 TaxID=3032208 RepID=UPI0024A5468E|nr:AMP-binding protein [Actinomycetospora sp. NBRC 106378]GLZ52015.1 ATP-dependent acyl-CoA ligase [Actinomycetospora sp. NBRC 106378]
MGLPALEDRTLLAAVERALAVGDAVTQTDRTGTWTLEQAFERSLRVGGGLGAGVDRPVALLLDNSLDAVHVWLGVVLTGGVEVPVNTAYKGAFLAHVLRDCGAVTLVVEAHYLDRLARIADEVPALRTVVVRGPVDGHVLPPGRFRVIGLDEVDAPANPVRRRPEDLHAIMYTSGTTGLSKGVLVPHAHAYTYASREHQERPRAGDRALVTLPVFHLAGQWYGVYQALIHAIPCVLEPGFSVGGFWPTVREHGITITVLLGAMAELLAQRAPAPDDADNPLELAIMAPLASDVASFRRRFGVDLAAVYGMSEIGAVLDGPPETVVGGEAGFPREGYDLRLVDVDGRDVGPGEIGELLVRPQVPHTVMAGYHGRPEETARVVRDGWLHTGDAFRTDDAGRFFFCDRMKDALRRRGENISSFEVERTVNEHPAVYESAVVAVPSALTEDEIKVVVVLQPDAELDPAELTTFLVDRLPYFMVPRYVETADALPKTPTHKVQKNLLRDAGVGPATWDREAAGIRVTRNS